MVISHRGGGTAAVGKDGVLFGVGGVSTAVTSFLAVVPDSMGGVRFFSGLKTQCGSDGVDTVVGVMAGERASNKRFKLCRSTTLAAVSLCGDTCIGFGGTGDLFDLDCGDGCQSCSGSCASACLRGRSIRVSEGNMRSPCKCFLRGVSTTCGCCGGGFAFGVGFGCDAGQGAGRGYSRRVFSGGDLVKGSFESPGSGDRSPTVSLFSRCGVSSGRSLLFGVMKGVLRAGCSCSCARGMGRGGSRFRCKMRKGHGSLVARVVRACSLGGLS